MSDMNSTTTLPGELSDETENEVHSEGATVKSEDEMSPKSVDRVRKVPPKLHASAKSQSMYDFTANGQTTEPRITISGATARYDADRPGTGGDSLDEQVNRLQTARQKSASANDFHLSVNRRRGDSVESVDADETDYEARGGRQLRIRSSIISLFARMGRDRRISNNSSNTNNENDNSPPLRALPQIAAQKILRAFSYVGKNTKSESLLALTFAKPPNQSIRD